jgi:Fe-Mn family superoxide dismutase
LLKPVVSVLLELTGKPSGDAYFFALMWIRAHTKFCVCVITTATPKFAVGVIATFFSVTKFSTKEPKMEHTLPALPYPMDALQPHISKETFEYHYGKHHQAYVTNLNKLIKGTEFENATLETIIKKAPAGDIYNDSAQVWNHTFFWNCMKPNGGAAPTGGLAAAINKKWGSHDEFKKAFQTSAVDNFGSGWTWLVKKTDGSVDIVNMGAAGTPLTTGDKALLCIDVWEHAYYIDYRNLRPKFVENFLNHLANWEFAAKNFA